MFCKYFTRPTGRIETFPGNSAHLKRCRINSSRVSRIPRHTTRRRFRTSFFFFVSGAPAMSVIFETSKGNFTIDLYIDDCPNTCKNFLKLCKVKYYNNCIFFNVQKDYIVQTGDPQNDGKGGQSVYGSVICVGDFSRIFFAAANGSPL
jgi:hypothetical protein